MTATGPARAQPQEKQSHDTSTLEQRLKAAGLDGDTIPDNIYEFRRRLARTIDMFLNAWHGCPERLCRRHHGCMAPNGGCTNVPPASPEEMERDWPQAKAELHDALQELLAAHGEEDT
jgi:hypothetical protein